MKDLVSFRRTRGDAVHRGQGVALPNKEGKGGGKCEKRKNLRRGIATLRFRNKHRAACPLQGKKKKKKRKKSEREKARSGCTGIRGKQNWPNRGRKGISGGQKKREHKITRESFTKSCKGELERAPNKKKRTERVDGVGKGRSNNFVVCPPCKRLPRPPSGVRNARKKEKCGGLMFKKKGKRKAKGAA